MLRPERSSPGRLRPLSGHLCRVRGRACPLSFRAGLFPGLSPAGPAVPVPDRADGRGGRGRHSRAWRSPIGLRFATGFAWGTILPFYFVTGVVDFARTRRERRISRHLIFLPRKNRIGPGRQGGPMNPQRPEYLRPALIAGAVAGLLSGLPFIGAGNCICCLWVVGGAVMASKLLAAATPGLLTSGDGAVVGALTGIVAAVVDAIISIPLAVLQPGAGPAAARQGCRARRRDAVRTRRVPQREFGRPFAGLVPPRPVRFCDRVRDRGRLGRHHRRVPVQERRPSPPPRHRPPRPPR